MEAAALLALIGKAIEKGLPAVKWVWEQLQGEEITLEKIQALKITKMPKEYFEE